MKTFVRSMLITGALALGASGLTAAQLGNPSQEQWFEAKYGRPSPMEEARQKAERESTAFREVMPALVHTAAPRWSEQYFRAKFGRSTPAEEARSKAERESTAFREEFAAPVAPGRSWIEELHRAKYGRLPGK